MDKKEEIIKEYFSTDKSFTDLQHEFGIARSIIHRWVSANQKETESSRLQVMKKNATEDLPADILELQKQLISERLHTKLLSAMIDIAERELKIPIRKKYGTKPLKK